MKTKKRMVQALSQKIASFKGDDQAYSDWFHGILEKDFKGDREKMDQWRDREMMKGVD